MALVYATRIPARSVIGHLRVLVGILSWVLTLPLEGRVSSNSDAARGLPVAVPQQLTGSSSRYGNKETLVSWNGNDRPKGGRSHSSASLEQI